MKIQSLSIAVPGGQCINNCAFCVSRMHYNDYEDRISKSDASCANSIQEYLARLNYARDNGCNSLMLTGNCEPQQNRQFLKMFGFVLRMMDNPFRQVEIQTTGLLLDEDYLLFLRDWIKVTTISLSISSFDSNKNASIIGMPNGLSVDLSWLCQKIKELGFTLRLSINLTDSFTNLSPKDALITAKTLKADQVTFRKMYSDGGNTSQAKWLAENTRYIDYKFWDEEIPKIGRFLRKLEYGQSVYDIFGMSVVYDTDCMGKAPAADNELKYLILRPDCKLYSQWDTKASLIF